ncbi:hypothetical protein [Kitasatospora sp. MBT63]|uniref:hypothetical protein n=1 Tax=Kitasatospora sp. MBT63 TaxID=1444768 RepID=UPI000539A32D|nr:hypothetical protein [Kitasatospora sp. MBT63]
MSRGAVNRTILAVAGALLVAGGLLVLAGGLDLYRRLGLSMPAGWPLTARTRPLLGVAARARVAGHSWWWPVVIAVLVLLVIGALAWLAAQLRRTRSGSLELAPPLAATALLVRGRAVEDVVEAATVALPGVERVSAQLGGPPGAPVVRAAVRLTTHGSPAELLEGFRTGPLARTRRSLGLPTLRSELRLRVAPQRRPSRRKQPRVR